MLNRLCRFVVGLSVLAMSVPLLVPDGKIAAVGAVTNVNTPTMAGLAAQWTFTLTLANAHSAGIDTVNISWPEGVTVPPTLPGALVTWDGTAVSTAGVNTAVSGRTLTFIIPATAAAGSGFHSIVVSQLAGVLNPNKATANVFTASVTGTPLASNVVTIGTSLGAEAAGTAGTGFTVTPTLVNSAALVEEGGEVIISGSGFTANTAIDLTSVGPPALTAAGGGTTDDKGLFTSPRSRTRRPRRRPLR